MSGKEIGLIIACIFVYLLWWPAGLVMTILLLLKREKLKKTTYIITDENGKTYTITKTETNRKEDA